MLANFRGVAAATSNSVSTNIPQAVLPALATLAGSDTLTLESLSFDPDLPDPEEFEYIDDDDATPGPIGDKSRRADD